MKLISSENIVFVPLKVKDVEYLREHFRILSEDFPEDNMVRLYEHFTNLLKMLDII